MVWGGSESCGVCCLCWRILPAPCTESFRSTLKVFDNKGVDEIYRVVALAAIGIAASVIGAFYYLKVCKIIMFDDPADEVAGSSPTSHWALLIITSLIISPLGFLLTPSLGDLADKAASVLFTAL